MTPVVLAIDDSPATLVSIQQAALGCRLLTAATRSDGQRLIAEHLHEATVVLLDMALPDGDGAAICAEIRTRAPGMPIIVLTGYPDALARVQAFGITAAIIKPAGVDEIRRVLGKVLGWPPVAAHGNGGGIATEDVTRAAPDDERAEIAPVVGATWRDIDLALVQTHIQHAIARRGYVEAENPLDYLRHHECIVGDRFDPHPTLLGIIAFGREPKRFHAAEVDIARFTTTYEDPASMDLRHIVTGTAFALIEESLAKLDAMNPYQSRIERGERIDTHRFPPKVIRELVANAVLHRDLSMRRAGIQVKVFPDRIEVVSPGGLPPGMTVDILGQTGGVRRNPGLAELLRNGGLVERFGLGYKVITRALEDLGLGDPVIVNHDLFFSVTVPARSFVDAPTAVPPVAPKPLPLGVTPRQREILKIIAACGGGPVTRADISAQFGLSDRQLQRELSWLVEAGVLREEGATNKRRYFRV